MFRQQRNECPGYSTHLEGRRAGLGRAEQGKEGGHSPLWKQLKERLVEAEGHDVPGTAVSLHVTITDPKRTFFTAPQPSCTCPLTLL